MNERQIGIEKMRKADHGDKSRADALTIPRDLLNDLIDDVQSFADQVPCREREKAFRADLLARARAIAAFPVEQPALLTAQDALAAIETFEIVGDNNDSREPNAEDRFILTEFVAHLFGGFRVELPAAAPASANETGAEGAADEAALRKSMQPEQIRLERKLTCEAIDGAMAFGYQNTNPPPSDDHWLAPYWKIGRLQAEVLDTLHAIESDLLLGPHPSTALAAKRARKLIDAISQSAEG